MTDDTLLNVPGYAPAALVVEFNLYKWSIMEDTPDMCDGETETEYLDNLRPVWTEPDVPLVKHCRRKALMWSDHYRRVRG